jgi:hypothetical protein
MADPRSRTSPWLNLLGILAAIAVVIYLLRGIGVLGFVPGVILLGLGAAIAIVGLMVIWGVGRRSW